MPFTILFTLTLAVAFLGDVGSTIELAHPVLKLIAAWFLALIGAVILRLAMQRCRQVAQWLDVQKPTPRARGAGSPAASRR